MKLQDHQSTRRGLIDMRLAQNSEVYLLVSKKLLKEEPLDDAVFPEELRKAVLSPEGRPAVPVPRYFACQSPLAATCNARTTVHARHASTLPA